MAPEPAVVHAVPGLVMSWKSMTLVATREPAVRVRGVPITVLKTWRRLTELLLLRVKAPVITWLAEKETLSALAAVPVRVKVANVLAPPTAQVDEPVRLTVPYVLAPPVKVDEEALTVIVAEAKLTVTFAPSLIPVPKTAQRCPIQVIIEVPPVKDWVAPLSNTTDPAVILKFPVLTLPAESVYDPEAAPVEKASEWI